MKKIITIATFSLFISGCETALQAYDMSQKGSAGFSCSEITRAFSAYKRDRTSAEALAVLVPLASPGTGVPENVSTASDAYYARSKAAANIALTVQGCSVIP